MFYLISDPIPGKGKGIYVLPFDFILFFFVHVHSTYQIKGEEMFFFRTKLLSSSFNKIKIWIPCNINNDFWSV